MGKEEGIEPLPWWGRLGDGNQKRIRLLMAPVEVRIKRERERGSKTESRVKRKKRKRYAERIMSMGSVPILFELGSWILEMKFRVGSAWR